MKDFKFSEFVPFQLNCFSSWIPPESFYRFISDIDLQPAIDLILPSYSSLGREAIDPIFLLRLLIIKHFEELSDVRLCYKIRVDVELRAFLGIPPEFTDPLLNPSSLTKFRKLHLNDYSLLNKLIKSSIAFARKNGIKISNRHLVDSTHISSSFTGSSFLDSFRHIALAFISKLKPIDPALDKLIPSVTAYTSVPNLIGFIDRLIEDTEYVDDMEKFSLSREQVIDEYQLLLDKYHQSLKDKEIAPVYKHDDQIYQGYKVHTAVEENHHLITGEVVTGGSKSDYNQLKELHQAIRANCEEDPESITGDGAYGGRSNLRYAEENRFKLFAVLNPNTNAGCTLPEGFTYDKEDNRVVCPNDRRSLPVYRFDEKTLRAEFPKKNCENCPSRDTCTGEAKKQIKFHLEEEVFKRQQEMMASVEGQEQIKKRKNIERVFAQEKEILGLDETKYLGIKGASIQASLTALVYNLKRIGKITGKTNPR